MKLSFGQGISLAVFAVLLMLLGALFALYQTTASLIAANRWVNHTHTVLSVVEQVRSANRDAQIHQVRYLLTRDETNLAPYSQAVGEVRQGINRLKLLTADNQQTRNRIDELETNLNNAVLHMDKVILTKKENGFEAAIALWTEKDAFQPVRATVRHIQDEQRELLQKTYAQAEHKTNQTNLTVSWLIAAVVLTFGLLITITNRYLKARAIGEAERKATEEALHEIGLEATKARDQALRSSKLKAEFLANMSHEIRTPLNGILGMAEVLLRSDLSPKDREYVAVISEAGRALLSIINDVLDFSKIEAGKLVLEIVDFEPVKLVESVGELLSEQAHLKQLSLLTFIDPEMPSSLLGDPNRIRQILLNLAGNAIKFSDHGEIVIKAEVVATTSKDAKIRFTVSDEGIGMSQQELDRLFQPFVQLDGSTSRKFGGTGLGLCICKRITELMEGRIDVSSTLGEGSTFILDLVLERNDSLFERSPVKPDLNGIKVLVVDDEPHAREIIHNYLISWGMSNGTASNGKQALNLLSKAVEDSQPYQIAVIDLAMPEMTGIELAKAIKQDPALTNVKLILVSSYDKPMIGNEAVALGFSGYLVKPIRQSQLLNCMTNALAGQESTAATLANMAKAVNHSSPTKLPTRSELILVVEDHPVNQQVTLLLLREMGFECHIAANGLAALQCLDVSDYSLILMDCQMPEMDGFEATHIIRKKETLTGKHLPILAMTAHAMEGSREQCLAAGMDDYISKPINAELLEKLIDRWLPNKKGQSNELLVTIASLEKRFGKNNARQIVDIFLASTPTTLNQLKIAINKENHKEVLQLAHYLKGSCMTFGFSAMSTLSSKLEELAKVEELEQADKIHSQLCSAFEQLKANLIQLPR